MKQPSKYIDLPITSNLTSISVTLPNGVKLYAKSATHLFALIGAYLLA